MTSEPSDPGGVRHYLTAFGTRPEIIKLAPVIAELRARGNPVTVVNTGQHRDESMNRGFARDLDIDVDVDFGNPPADTALPGWILNGAIEVVNSRRPDAVLLLGDTLTVPLFALAARMAGVPVIHLEAGMRSLNEHSIEEVDRKMMVGAASIHFAPTVLSANFLVREGVPADRVFTVGNSITDALLAFGPARVPVEQRHGLLLTAHRASNVDSMDRLRRIVDLAIRLTDLGEVTFPVHPRTMLRLRESGLDSRLVDVPGLTLLGPIDYSAMLERVASARLVVTDSGGVQEECSWYGIPVVVLRRTTPRWEGVRDGAVHLRGIDSDAELDDVLTTARRLCDREEQHRISVIPCPYGDGHVCERIADVLARPETTDLLTLHEHAVDLDELPWGQP